MPHCRIFDPTYVGMAYTFLAIRALIGGACPDDQDLQYSLHRLSSLTPSSVHNQLKLLVAILSLLPANLTVLFSSVLSQSTTLARPFAVFTAARGDLFPSTGIG